MKEVPISKRSIVIIFLLVAVLAGGVFTLQRLIPTSTSGLVTPSPNDQMASAAATKAVEAFFTVDYQVGMDSWLNRLCDLTTDSGCQFISIGASPMWDRYLEEKTIVMAEASALQKVADKQSEQVWQVNVSLSAALPGSNKLLDTTYVVVSKTDTGWLFDRFLLQPEINALLVKQGKASQYGRNF